MMARSRRTLARMEGDGAEPPLPPLARQAAGLAGAAARAIGAAIVGGAIMADDATVAARLSICKACDHYRPSDDRCGKMDGCGCYVTGPLGKASWATEHCPIGKW